MRGSSRNYLFSDGELCGTLDAQRTAAVRAVSAIPRDQFLATSTDTLVEHLVAEHSVEPLVLHEDQMRMEHDEARIEVTGRFDYGFGNGERAFAAGHRLTFYVPFSGDAQLWRMRPNLFFSMMPTGEVDSRNGLLKIALANTSNTEPEYYKRELNSQLDSIRQLIAAQAQMLAQHSQALPAQVRAAVERRRAEVDKLQGLAAAFDIPLVKKAGMPEFRPIEVSRKVPRPLPRPPVAGYKPEPAISDQNYEDILGIIRHAGATFEVAPQTYKSLGEEGLRDNVLSHLNAVFEGRATGETFRKYGKTDIRIEEESRSAFVGECKLWGGEKVLLEALDQLLGYLTWRDCKAALVMFNKEVAAFSGVQQTIEASLMKHSRFLRAKETGLAGEWRFVFRSAEDDSREVTVHVFAFNLFVAKERAAKNR